MNPNPFPGAGQGLAFRTSEGEQSGIPPPGGMPPASAHVERAPLPEPPSGTEINAALYNATRYTGDPAQTHTIPAPVADLKADNIAFAQAMIARWSKGITLWVAAQLQMASWEVADSLPAIRLRLAQHLARLFAGRARVHPGIYGQAIHASSLRDFMRVALQGAQQLKAGNEAAEITAASTGAGLSTSYPAFQVWRNNWSRNATAWMQERQALDWAIVPEIIAGLPLRPREFSTEPRARTLAVAMDVVNYYGAATPPVVAGRNLQSVEYERDPTYRSATGEGTRQWPQGFGIAGANISADMIVYAWDGWREELSQSNRVASYALCISLQPDTLQQLCGEYGVRPDLADKEKIIAVAESWAMFATETNLSLMVQVARDGEAQGLPSRKSLKALEDAAVTFGAGGFFQDLWNGIKRIARHVSDWFRELGRKLGAFLQVLGREVRRWARIPIIGDLFIIATGIEFVYGTLLPELGRCLQTGKISAFRVKELGFGVGRLLDRAGRALAMAAPFLPPPFMLAAAALAAVSIVAGGAIGVLLSAEENKKRIEAYNAAKKAAFDKKYAEIMEAANAGNADNPAETEAAQGGAYDTLMDYMQREGKLGEGMLDASKDLATRGVSAFSKIALAAGGVIAIGFASYLVTRKS